MSRIRHPVRKESVDERKTSKEWRDLGYFEFKVVAANKGGIPDRYYSSGELGVRFFCEWKREDTDVVEGSQQDKRISEMRDNGDVVIVAHSREDFWRQVHEMRRK